MAKQHERSLARRLGGWRQPLSGAKPERRGDVILPGYLVEAKETERATFTLTTDILRKIEWEALANDKKPMLVVKLGNQEWGCLRIKDLQALIEEKSDGRMVSKG